jgi:hypothetical protein
MGRARRAAFGERLAATPLAARPYDLRDAAISTWLNAGVPPTQVAEWAGHSVEVLLTIYANCIDGDAARYRAKIDDASRSTTNSMKLGRVFARNTRRLPPSAATAGHNKIAPHPRFRR